MDEYLTLNQGVDEFESLREYMEDIEKDAERLFKKYSWPILKMVKFEMDLSEYEKKVLDKALDLHYEAFKKKLEAPLAH